MALVFGRSNDKQKDTDQLYIDAKKLAPRVDGVWTTQSSGGYITIDGGGDITIAGSTVSGAHTHSIPADINGTATVTKGYVDLPVREVETRKEYVDFNGKEVLARVVVTTRRAADQ